MRGKITVILLATALLAPSLVLGMSSFDYPVVDPVISFVEGDVSLRSSGAAGWERAKVGTRLGSGDTVRTGTSSRAEISCATGKVRLYENTVIIVPEVTDEGEKRDLRGVKLDDGTGLFNIRKRGAERGFEVRTSNIIAGVKGTLFAVEHEKGKRRSKVAVYRGVVRVSDTERTPGTITFLRRGEFMEVKDGSGFGETDEFGPDNVWYKWERLNSLEMKPPRPDSDGSDSGYSGPQE
jgi:ferric-dicitrate binding protein FerR (iron transport regulator)